MASGLINTSLQIGGAVVLAVITAILGTGGAGSTTRNALLPGMTTAVTVVVGIGVAAMLLALALVLPRRRTAQTTTQQVLEDGSPRVGDAATPGSPRTGSASAADRTANQRRRPVDQAAALVRVKVTESITDGLLIVVMLDVVWVGISVLTLIVVVPPAAIGGTTSTTTTLNTARRQAEYPTAESVL